MTNFITLAVLTIVTISEVRASIYQCDGKSVTRKEALEILESKKAKECLKIDRLILKNTLGIEKSKK